jgi:hypothetical protein
MFWIMQPIPLFFPVGKGKKGEALPLRRLLPFGGSKKGGSLRGVSPSKKEFPLSF